MGQAFLCLFQCFPCNLQNKLCNTFYYDYFIKKKTRALLGMTKLITRQVFPAQIYSLLTVLD